jgi:hypothetical protein
MKFRRSRTAALCALAVAAVPATSAHAATGALVGGGSFARTIPFIDGDIYAFECHAAAPGALTTRVTSCALTSTFGTVSAPAASSTGPAAATDGAVSWDPSPNHVCWTVSATFADGTTQTKSGCSTTSDTGGAGVG